MFCSECGAQIPDEGGFCPDCGTPALGKNVNDQQENELTATMSPVPTLASTPEFTAGFDPTPTPTSTYFSETAPFPDTTNQHPPQGVTPQYAPPDSVNSNMPQPPVFQQSAPDLSKPKKSKKGLFIALGAALLVILLVVGGFVGFNIYRSSNYDDAVTLFNSGEYQQAYDAFDKLGDYQDAPLFKDLAQNWLDYEAARALLDAEDFEGAKSAFEALAGFEDSADFALLCQHNIDYLAAINNYEDGDFEGALTAFSTLASLGFADASDWADKTSYALAAGLYDAGDYYAAFKAFQALGTYEDSSARMEECTTAYPSTGEYYHNGDYASSASAIAIDAGNAKYAAYFKIYSGSTLVSTIFLNAGGSCTIEVPPGYYSIKEATGDYWFGEEIMFGDEGYYEVMLFDGGNDYFDLPNNIITTITLSTGNLDGGSSVGADPTTREDF
ncbi:MAG: zinc-ribbon domain-containing protein [Coriobacteriales bacterium]|jgi:tetratricopeptide (TPR) repeat protein|nr:zinc-ribbon domain-containing protein [Coriobacteriales bacterium]